MKKAAPRGKIIFISDVHLGGGKDFDWLGVSGRKNLISFLTGLATDAALAELVFVGDMLDCWVWPFLDKIPPAYSQILGNDENKDVVNALKTLCARPEITVTSIQGNHDMDAWRDLPQALKTAFPGIRYEPIGIERGPLWAEHGSLHTMFNAPDPLHDPKDGLPLGYFITRVNESKQVKDRQDTVGSIVGEALEAYLTERKDIIGRDIELSDLRLLTSQEIERIQENFIAEHFAAWVFEFVVNKAGKTLSDSISMPGGASLILKSIRDRYADLYADKVKELGKKGAWDSLLAEIDMMEPMAETEGERRHKKAVLFGHSHHPHMEKAACIYLNDGCFLKQPSFIAAEPVGSGYKITLWRWREDGSTEWIGDVTI